MLKIQEYLKAHGLDATVEKFKLQSKDLGHKVMFKYDQLESSNVHQEVHEARGLILAKDTWEVISMPFERFYNYGDFYAAKLYNVSTVYTEKRDGTLIQVYYDKFINNWCVNTMFGECNDRMFNGEKTFREIFDELMEEYGSSFDLFKIGNTYIFELTSPYNKVVVTYNKPELRLIGVRSLGDLKEYDFAMLEYISPRIKIPVVETYKFDSPEDCIKSFYGRSFNFEGYVAFDGINRVKIKNPAYVAVHLTHHVQSEVLDMDQPHIFLDIVKQNEIDEFKIAFPETADLINTLYSRYYSLILKLNEIKEIVNVDAIKNDKKIFAVTVLAELENRLLSKDLSAPFFMMNSGKVGSIQEYLMNCDNKKLIKLI